MVGSGPCSTVHTLTANAKYINSIQQAVCLVWARFKAQNFCTKSNEQHLKYSTKHHLNNIDEQKPDFWKSQLHNNVAIIRYFAHLLFIHMCANTFSTLEFCVASSKHNERKFPKVTTLSLRCTRISTISPLAPSDLITHRFRIVMLLLTRCMHLISPKSTTFTFN